MTTLAGNCPVCGVEAADAPAVCPRCGADLAGFWRTVFRPWLSYNQALAWAAEGRTAAAARAAYAAVVQEPERAEFRFLLAQLLGTLGELDEALEHTRAVCRGPNSPEAERLLEFLLRRKFSPPAAAVENSEDARK